MCVHVCTCPTVVTHSLRVRAAARGDSSSAHTADPEPGVDGRVRSNHRLWRPAWQARRPARHLPQGQVRSTARYLPRGRWGNITASVTQMFRLGYIRLISKRSGHLLMVVQSDRSLKLHELFFRWLGRWVRSGHLLVVVPWSDQTIRWLFSTNSGMTSHETRLGCRSSIRQRQKNF